MSEPFIAQIKIFAGNFAPRGWALCNGQFLQISQNQSLYSLLGTTYGGDGRITFALPDLRGRAPLHPGSGPGLTTRFLGWKGGLVENSFTTQRVVREHAHSVAAGQRLPRDSVVGNTETVVTPDFDVSVSPGTQASIPNIQPYLAVNFIIALVGVFPSRN